MRPDAVAEIHGNHSTGTPAMSPKTDIPADATAQPRTATITLETPIVRGEQRIESITLRKPAAGELRGLALADLLRSDVSALQTLLPRISTPTLTAADAAALDLPDLAAIAGEVLGFFMSRADKAALSPSA